MTDGFLGAFLSELGSLLHLPNLHPDKNNACLIKFKGDLQVQIEVAKSGKHLLVGIDLGSISPGRYRENIFETALMTNGLPPPHHGTFAYSQQTDHLILFHLFPLKSLRAQSVSDFLHPFLDKARIWKEALSKHTVPAVKFKGKTGSGMFGLTS